MRFKISVLWLVTVSALLGVYLRSSVEFANHDLLFVALIVACVLAAEVILICGIQTFTKTPVMCSLTGAVAVIFNIYCLRGSLIDKLAVLPSAVQIVAFLGGVFVVYTFYSAVDERGVRARSALMLVATLALADLVPGIIVWHRSAVAGVPLTTAGSDTASSNVKLVEFEYKPNVYIVAFDSLMPSSLVEKHFGRAGFPYNNVLKARFRAFPNMFADDVPTKPSLNSILAFDPDYFHSLDKRQLQLYAGHIPSPLFQIFKFNGYTTNTFYRSNYFGAGHGRHVDKYHTHKRLTLCEFIDKSTSAVTLFGYCRFVKSPTGRSFQDRLFGRKLPQFEFLLNKFKRAKTSNSPNVFVSYIYHPGHTKKNYRHANLEKRTDYLEFHVRKSVETVRMIRRLTEFVDQQPGKAVLIIVGDHGPWLSRGMSPKSDPTFYIQDRYGIYGGIYPADTCRSTIDRASRAKFTTISIVVRRVVECLSGGKDPFIRTVDYRIREFSRLGLPDRYEEHVYE